MAHRTRASIARPEVDGEANATTMPIRTRRPHKKSRNGCTECKHRHIRCDERRPTCINCEAADRVCSFPKPRVRKHKDIRQDSTAAKQSPLSEATTSTLPDSEASSQEGTRINVITDENHTELPLTAHHLSQLTMPGHPSVASMHVCYAPHLTVGSYPSSGRISSTNSPLPHSQSHTPPADSYPGLSTISEIASAAIFTPQHMILLHHASAVPNYTGPNRSAVDIAIRYIIEAPYLMDEVLAFTAFHMAGLYPGSAVCLRNLATELQNRALACFARLTETLPADDKATAVPRFLFSSILGRHVLADTLTHCSLDFHYFVDRLVECINLNRGIICATPPAWKYLYSTEIGPFIAVVREAEDRITSPGMECNPLHRLMDHSDLKEASVEACRQAIDVLQRCFDIARQLKEEDYPSAVSVFSVKVGAGFVDVLRKHQPESLVILAFYGVLLYRCRTLWAFSDAGASMIRVIAERVGSYHQEALLWPLSVLETE